MKKAKYLEYFFYILFGIMLVIFIISIFRIPFIVTDKTETIKVTDEVVMPDLIGLDKYTAQEVLNNLELGYVYTKQEISDIPIHMISSQSIAAGENVKKHTKIYLTESLGVGAFIVPNVENMTLERAEEILNENNLTYTVEYEQNHDIGEGIIIKTIPYKDCEVYEQDNIILIVSSGRTLTVDDLENNQIKQTPLKVEKLENQLNFIQDTIPENIIPLIREQIKDETTVSYKESIDWLNDYSEKEKLAIAFIINNSTCFTKEDIPDEINEYVRTINEITEVIKEKDLPLAFYNWENFKCFSEDFSLEKFNNDGPIIGDNIDLSKEEFKVLSNIPEEYFDKFYEIISKETYRSYFLSLSYYEDFTEEEKIVAKYICTGTITEDDLSELNIELKLE